jgi:hypothetical protein
MIDTYLAVLMPLCLFLHCYCSASKIGGICLLYHPILGSMSFKLLVFLSCYNKYNKHRGLNNKNFFFIVLEKSMIQVSVDSTPSKGFLPGSQIFTFLICYQMGREREGEREREKG